MVLLLLAATTNPVRAQESAVEFAPREEVTFAIIFYAYSGGCETLRNVFGPMFDSVCHDPNRTTGFAEHMLAFGFLGALRDEALIEICKKYKIRDCEKEQETSRGRPILTFVSAIRLMGDRHRPVWSPDNRFLLIDNLPKREVRLLDVNRGTLRDPHVTMGIPEVGAWSSDGKYLALSERKGGGTVRLYLSSSLEEIGMIGASKESCGGFGGLAPSAGMAFTADSQALWVTCFSLPERFAKVIKLKVPRLEIEDSMVLAPPGPDWRPSFSSAAILHHADDLILTGTFHKADAKTAHAAIQSYSLTTKEPLHPPVVIQTKTETSIVRWVSTPHLTDDLSGVYVEDELWSTKTGERVATEVKSSGRYLGAPNRIPQLKMHLEPRGNKNAMRGELIVVESESGATIQEIGPINKVAKILVSPDGSKVAVFSFHGIRFYRVNHDAATTPAAQGRLPKGPRYPGMR
jgi:hypothetical protein